MQICIDSKGKERDHKTLTQAEKEAEANALPRFGLDYAFFSEELELEGSEEKGRGSIKVAIMKEKRVGWFSAHLAQRKGGGDEFVARRLAKDIDVLGGNDVVIRSDQEPAMKDLVSQIRVNRAGNTTSIPEEAPQGDSKSNGR